MDDQTTRSMRSENAVLLVYRTDLGIVLVSVNVVPAVPFVLTDVLFVIHEYAPDHVAQTLGFRVTARLEGWL